MSQQARHITPRLLPEQRTVATTIGRTAAAWQRALENLRADKHPAMTCERLADRHTLPALQRLGISGDAAREFAAIVVASYEDSE